MGLAAPLLGFAALMLGGFSRFGLWRQMGLAVGLLIGMQLLWTWGGSEAIQTEGAWPAVYLAPLVGLFTALGLLWYGQQPRRLRRVAS
jgi:lipopolysaccharide export system permease protein